MQTLRNFVTRPSPKFPDSDSRSLEFPMEDGTGDVMSGVLNAPRVQDRAGRNGKPLVLLIHGLTGCFESFHVLLTAEYLLDQGYPVLRLNLRGAGPLAARCTERYYAGRSADLRALLDQLDEAHTGHGVVAVGYSLGGNMLLKYLGEEGELSALRAAASVSAPIDLAAAAQRFLHPRNAPYQHYLLKRMKEETTANPAATTPDEKHRIEGARTVYEFDDVYIAPRYGFRDAPDYYAQCMARRFLPGIRVPTLLIHAKDDPWIPIEAYTGFEWDSNANLTPLFPARGGHVGFHGTGSMTPWNDRCIAQFFDDIVV